MAAAMRSRRAPSFSMAATVASSTPAKRAFPAGMGGADHAGLGVGEQHRRAIGGQDAQRHAGHGRSPGRRLRGVLPKSQSGVHGMDDGAVDLRQGDQPARRAPAPPRRGRGSRPPRRDRRASRDRNSGLA